jgi:hypothetical protein
MKILNLDDLGATTRSVTLNGKDHAVKEMSVQDFILASQEAKRLEKLDENDFAANLDASVKHLMRVLPTITEAELRALSMRQIGVLVSFVNGALEEEAQKADLPKSEDAGKN